MTGQVHLEKLKSASKKGLAVMLCLLLLAGMSAAASPGQPMKDKYDIGGGSQEETAADLPEYWQLLEKYAQAGYAPGAGSQISGAWEGLEPTEGLEGYNGLAYRWEEGQESIQTTIRVEKTGLYVLALDYLALSGDVAAIQRGLLLDGQSVCVDSENIPFDRQWEESGDTFFDYNGDERSPQLQQVCRWSKQYFQDTNAFYSEPMQFYLTAGEHTVTLKHVSGNMTVGALHVEAPALLPTYEEYLARHDAPDYTGENLYLDAEKAAYRSDRTIRRQNDSDPASYPFAYSQIRLNAIGGDRWQNGGQYLTWKVQVPQTGYYQINARFLQTTGNGLVIYRQLLVNGEVPFREANELPFPYARGWQTAALNGGDGVYRIYLEEGEQEITLRVVSGALRDVQNSLKTCGRDLSNLLRDILTIVGSSPDPNFEYELEKKIPWLIPTLENLRDELQQQAEHLREISGKQATIISNLLSAADELDGYIRHPDTIPVSSGSDGSLTVMQTNLSTWYTEILATPLTLDFLELAAPGSEVKPVKSSFFQRAKATFMNFIASFVKDYNHLGGDAENAAAEEISLWIARGREWGELLQQMADEEFTPRTGIRVRVNILPSGSVGAIGGVSPLLLSIVTGNSPNLAIGSDSSTPVELAIRKSVVDLSQMPGYAELAENFVSGALEPFLYNGGVYALPETMDFQFMMVRTDIFDELKLEVPEDWESLYSRVLPSLKQNNYNFYIPITTSVTAQYQYCAFYTYLYQHGGELYDDAGLNSLLDNEVAYAAFYQWVRSYTQYNLPREINTFNHFRVGDVPLFVGGLNEYLTLKVAAPELYGKWEIARIPGTRQADGSINRQAIGALTSCIMFDKGEESNDAAWEFLQWYMSADVQQRYGEDIEAAVGLQARWFTANTEAFRNLPWDKEDLAVFEEAMLDMRNPRNVLGGYITGRQLNNAWTRAVMNGQEPRVALEEAVKEIQRELKRKQDEYGIGGD